MTTSGLTKFNVYYHTVGAKLNYFKIQPNVFGAISKLVLKFKNDLCFIILLFQIFTSTQNSLA
jgi:hypothetical protein